MPAKDAVAVVSNLLQAIEAMELDAEELEAAKRTEAEVRADEA